jgi:hypothetical protein
MLVLFALLGSNLFNAKGEKLYDVDQFYAANGSALFPDCNGKPCPEIDAEVLSTFATPSHVRWGIWADFCFCSL